MPGKKKLLFVSARLPYPTIEGHQIRTFGVLKELAKEFDIYLLSLLREGETVDKSNPLGELCEDIKGIPIPSGVFANIRAGINSLFNSLPLVVAKYVFPELIQEFKNAQKSINPDIIHLDLLPLAQLARHVENETPVVLNEHNVESELIEQKLGLMNSLIEKMIYKREYRLLAKFEAELCQTVNTVLACSDTDVDIIKGMGAKSVHCIPNGVEVANFNPGQTKPNRNRMVFLGGMGWYPNRLGVQWFVDEVLPLIVQENESMHLDLVGNPEPEVVIPEAMKRFVTVHGFVDDFRPIVNQAGIMIVPLHVGSGTRLKVVEAAALGKCMVSTNKGAEGVMLEDHKEIVYADTAHDFAQAVLTISVDEEKVMSIGQAARKVAEDIYDWPVIGKKLLSIYGDLHA